MKNRRLKAAPTPPAQPQMKAIRAGYFVYELEDGTVSFATKGAGSILTLLGLHLVAGDQLDKMRASMGATPAQVAEGGEQPKSTS